MVSAIDNKKEQKTTSNSSTSKTNDVGAFFRSILMFLIMITCIFIFGSNFLFACSVMSNKTNADYFFSQKNIFEVIKTEEFNIENIFKSAINFSFTNLKKYYGKILGGIGTMMQLSNKNNSAGVQFAGHILQFIFLVFGPIIAFLGAKVAGMWGFLSAIIGLFLGTDSWEMRGLMVLGFLVLSLITLGLFPALFMLYPTGMGLIQWGWAMVIPILYPFYLILRRMLVNQNISSLPMSKLPYVYNGNWYWKMLLDAKWNLFTLLIATIVMSAYNNFVGPLQTGLMIGFGVMLLPPIIKKIF